MADMLAGESGELVSGAEAEEMAKYEIVCVPVKYFHVGEFRYENLPDAVAEAKRRGNTG